MMKLLNNIFYILILILIVQITANCNAAERFSKDNKKTKVSQMYQHLSSVASSTHGYLYMKLSPKLQGTTHNLSSTHVSNTKKWQLDRVTRKHYEIINVKWKKTKLFINLEPYTPAFTRQVNETQNIFDNILHDQKSLQLSPPHSNSQTSTSSYIEFYYLDESNLYVQPKQYRIAARKNELNTKFNISNNSRNKSLVMNNEKKKISEYMHTISNAESFNDNKSCANITEPLSPVTDRSNSSIKLKQNSFYIKQHEQLTTVYDKIKFFEIYDKHTITYDKEKINAHEIDDIEDNKNDIIPVQKIRLEHVDQSVGYDLDSPHKVKKHIRHSFKNKSMCGDEDNLILKNISSTTIGVQNKKTTYFRNPTKSVPEEPKTLYSYVNKSVLWSEYPFVAVYVYEPARVHCDAAGISPHWLVTSGACLSQHHKNPSGEGRSAFVTFCGESWWHPERVAYVKYSLVHPRYHSRDRTRRHLYNIGVVQVVISMLSCPSWSPIPLMSHQYSTSQEGSLALALGWGLDRYDTRHTFMDLPKWPLMVYEGIAYSDSCPGNIGYSKAKRLEEEGGVNNVYCLSLPPYAGEEYDPIHGSLLLVGGKLTALFLQEERRSWGEQSAQYTGTWRLIPWVLEVACETEVEDSLILEI